MGIVATQSYGTIKFQGNRAKITLPDHAVVCGDSEVGTAQGCAKSAGLVRANGLWEC
jgi:hypothetical protein